jgi:hypothetical protein
MASYLSQVTQLPNGQSVGSGVCAVMPLQDDTFINLYSDDFWTFDQNQWTKTATGAATAALLAGANGLLKLTNTAGGTDVVWQQKLPAAVKLATGKRAWFKIGFQLSDATNTRCIVGLQNTNADPTAATDGVYFDKASAGLTANFLVKASSTATTTSSVATLANATQIELGFVWDGVSTIFVYVNGTVVAQSVATNLPSANLTLTFGIKNANAVANTMTVDYIVCGSDR